jgi:hypothetical protein
MIVIVKMALDLALGKPVMFAKVPDGMIAMPVNTIKVNVCNAKVPVKRDNRLISKSL